MKKIVLIATILTLICSNMFSQITKESVLAKATADSSSFVININEGWKQYGSSIGILPSDSIMLETIVQHANTAIDWSQEQFIGKVKSNSLRPIKDQTVTFDLLSSIYQIRIEHNGKCYLRLASGNVPDEDPVILPIRAVYKK